MCDNGMMMAEEYLATVERGDYSADLQRGECGAGLGWRSGWVSTGGAKPVLDAVPVDDGHLCHVVSPFVNPAFPRGHHVRVGAERNSLPNLKR